MNVGEVIKNLRKQHRLTQAQLAEKLNVAPTAVSAWERNENRPLMDKIVIISGMFNIPLNNFFDVTEMEPVSDLVTVPIVGKISCGAGGLAFEDIEGYEAIPKDWVTGGEYFYLRAKGDSMTGARIHNGDLLLIRKQDEVENGEIAAVLIGDEAVLKRVYKSGDTLILQSENSAYQPILCPPNEAKIIGKLKMATIKF